MPKQKTDAAPAMQLNDFQKATQERLQNTFAERGRTITFELTTLPPTRLSSEEPALKFAFDGYTSWVYLDGACVIGRDVDKVFEIYDYRSLDELQEAYVLLIEVLLEKSAP